MARKRERWRDAPRQMRDRWLDVFRALGEALLDVLRAEAELLWEHWKIWGKSMAVAVALLAAAFFLSFWVSGFLAVAAVHGIMDFFGWKLWQAALAIAGALMLVMALLSLAAYFLGRRIDNPIEASRHRFGDHRNWFQQTFLSERRLTGREESHGSSADATHAAGDGAAGESPPAR